MPPVDGKDAIYDLMQRVLDSIVIKFEQEEIELPERRYLSVGEVAHDCEQLTISFIQMYLGPPGQQAEAPSQCHDPRTAVIQVELTRTMPPNESRSSGPSPNAMNERTHDRTTDAWLLMDASLEAFQNEFTGVLTDVSVTNPQGGYQSVVLNLVVGIP